MKQLFSILTILMLLNIGTARAEDSIRSFLDDAEKGDGLTLIVLSSYVIGMNWVNINLMYHGRDPLYCVPSTVDLDAPDYIPIIKEWLRSRPDMGFFPAGGAMLYAMKYKFPCHKKGDHI